MKLWFGERKASDHKKYLLIDSVMHVMVPMFLTPTPQKRCKFYFCCSFHRNLFGRQMRIKEGTKTNPFSQTSCLLIEEICSTWLILLDTFFGWMNPLIKALRNTLGFHPKPKISWQPNRVKHKNPKTSSANQNGVSLV